MSGRARRVRVRAFVWRAGDVRKDPEGSDDGDAEEAGAGGTRDEAVAGERAA